jgi:16S rRNA (adenine1518-N6/adenine1519-N6)-dimethyltransferase
MEVKKMKVQEVLKELKIVPQKEWGQNFIINEEIAKKIVQTLKVKKEDKIIEIGPGIGGLTFHLATLGAKIYAIERDSILAKFLKNKFKHKKNVTIIEGNIFNLNLRTLGKKFKVISNLPYSITSQFLYWSIKKRNYFSKITLTLQKEVINKICAKVGEKTYGVISVLMQFYMKLSPQFLIPKNAFFPRSGVTSQVISLTPKTKLPQIDFNLFENLVKLAFRNRRKKIKNTLKLKGKMNFGIDINKRPEELTLQDYIKLTQKIIDNQ